MVTLFPKPGLTSSIKPNAARRAGDATLCVEQLFLPVPD